MTIILNFKKYQEENEKKKAVVFNQILSYYKDLDETGTVRIPYFIRAKEMYNELIKNYKDLDFLYQKILNHYNNL